MCKITNDRNYNKIQSKAAHVCLNNFCPLDSCMYTRKKQGDALVKYDRNYIKTGVTHKLQSKAVFVNNFIPLDTCIYENHDATRRINKMCKTN